MASSVRRTSLAAAVYAVAAGYFTWPLVTHPRGFFAALDPTGDPSLNLWALGWDLQTLAAHPTWILTGRVFDAPIFFPARHTLAYSDHLLLQAVALWPLHAATGDLVLCYNVLLVGSLIATALSMHLLARQLTGSEKAAYVAGLIFGFAPYHFSHLAHIQLQALYFLPLSLLLLNRLFDADRPTDTVGLGIILASQAVSSVYYGVIGGLGILGAGVVQAGLSGRLLDWRLIRRGVTAAALAIVIALPWLLPYQRVARETGSGRNLYEASQTSALPASYLQAPESNLAYGRTGWLRPGPESRLARRQGPEQGLFPGFCALLLAVLGVVLAPRDLRKAAAVGIVLAATGFVLSLGPDGIRPLYATLHDAVIGMEAIRAAARFSVLALLAIAILAAVAVRALEDRYPRAHPAILSALLVVIVVEFANGSLPFPQRPVLASGIGGWLRLQPGTGAVVCSPMGFGPENTGCMLQSLEHHRPIVNGYSGLRPPFFAALVDVVSRLPSSESLYALHEIGVEYIVARQSLELEAGLRGALVERARFGDERIYQIVWSPELEALGATTGPPPPEPGPPPFTVGESATYDIHWTSGPVNLSAGGATIEVVQPQTGEPFRFVLTARTAPWASRFFQTDALLETTASDRLLPVRHREVLNDGKRRTERELVFDFSRHTVQMTNAGASISLPLESDARDPLTALFFVRTLPFMARSRLSLPLSDNGRPSRLDIAIDETDTIILTGRQWPAWRLQPALRQRIERDAPFRITVWISADERRIPLRVAVAASFGSLQADLVSYRGR